MKDTGSLHVAGMAIAVYTARGDVDSAKEVARDLAERLPNSAEAWRRCARRSRWR